jgi:hypothetical protein
MKILHAICMKLSNENPSILLVPRTERLGVRSDPAKITTSKDPTLCPQLGTISGAGKNEPTMPTSWALSPSQILLVQRTFGFDKLSFATDPDKIDKPPGLEFYRQSAFCLWKKLG